MEEGLKEFRHNCSKTFRNGARCMGFKYYSCASCRGLCVFSDLFPKKYEKSETMSKMVQEKYFKKEFGLIRFYLNETSTLNEDEEEVESKKGFELIKKFHSLSKTQRGEVLKLHVNSSAPSNLHFHCKTKSTKITKLCFTCSHPKDWMFPIVPRNAKRQEMLKEQLNDIVLAE